MRVLHQDERLLAADKPAGLPTIPGRGLPPGSLKERLEESLGAKLFVVHRLDREASGVVLLAKDALAHRSLCLEFERRKVHKTYLAVVAGVVENDGEVSEPLREFGSGRTAVDPRGKPSLTRYRVLERLKGATLLEVSPVTGRRHQIRAHLYAAGHPILGDTLYGKPRPVGGAARLMLHALGLDIQSPDFRPLALRCEPPEDFTRALEALR